MEEAQTGALVLLVDDGQGHVTEAVGVLVFSNGQPYRLEFYAYALFAMEAPWTDGSVFEVTYNDHSYDWQILAARVDRQYWHGGAYDEALNFRNAEMHDASEGESAYFNPYIADSEYPVGSFAVTVDGTSPLTGIVSQSFSQIRLSFSGLLGGDTVFAPVPLSPQPDLYLVKAVLMHVSDKYCLRLLYPSYGDLESSDFYLISDDGLAHTGDSSPVYFNAL